MSTPGGSRPDPSFTGILMVVFSSQIEAIFGGIGYTNPVFFLLVYSPDIAGVWLVWRHHGTRG